MWRTILAWLLFSVVKVRYIYKIASFYFLSHENREFSLANFFHHFQANLIFLIVILLSSQLGHCDGKLSFLLREFQTIYFKAFPYCGILKCKLSCLIAVFKRFFWFKQNFIKKLRLQNMQTTQFREMHGL